MFLLVDCNNFFVSCERVFNPKLKSKPVVILSNNDGCIIARSQEAKDLGIPMGAPYFQWEDFLKRNHVTLLSSNYALYGDLSFRVMQTLEAFNPDLEIYSIDEAFLHLSSDDDPYAFAHFLRQKVQEWTGIPISIGIAKTKTLAKVANARAKKDPKCKGVFALLTIESQEQILETLPVEAIWGIGRKTSTLLQRKGVFTAAQLIHQSDTWIRNALTVTGLRTAWELRGISCLGLEEIAIAKKSIMTSRSFGRALVEYGELQEAVAAFASRGAEKLRKEKRLACALQVFVMTSPHKNDETFYSNAAFLTLAEPTAYTPTIISTAKAGLKQIYREGFSYKKAGVLLTNLVESSPIQKDFFVRQEEVYSSKQMEVMALIDHLNDKFGYPVIQFAAEGIHPGWKSKQHLTSSSFTTSWDELLTIDI